MGRILRLHGCIELDVPDDVGSYSAWQRLEELLEGAHEDVLGGVVISDYFAARIVAPGSGYCQTTSHFPDWKEEVFRDEQDPEDT